MANAKQQENLLLTEHFTWPPISLLDEIINNSDETLHKCIDTTEATMLGVDPALLGFSANAGESEEQLRKRANLEIEEGAQKLETLISSALEKNLDRLEIWTLRNVLCLPREEGIENWVRLGHYENIQIPAKDNTLTPEALYALRRKLTETDKLHAALVAEKNRNEAQIARLRALLQPAQTPRRDPRSSTSPSKDTAAAQDPAPFAFLTHSQAAQSLGIQPLPAQTASTSAPIANGSRTPLATHTSFTTSQLPYLRQLLAQLKPHLASAALPGGKGGEGEEWAKERRVYVESQSRRVLERRGVDTRDGVEGNVEGQRVRAEEIGALEGIVASFGAKQGDQGVEGEPMDTS
ncbi:hypothetical protein N0V90_009875 [Kalmusia sp. IMI 367209]|nr:hypothetical protein N0V90_009875 [Kalmusia sp. IMI 367209]